MNIVDTMRPFGQVLASVTSRVDAVELYRVDADKERHFSFGTWYNRQHAFLAVRVGGVRGWGETMLAANDPGISLQPLGALGDMVGQRICDVASALPCAKISPEALEMALLDVAGRLAGCSVMELLGYRDAGSIVGEGTILSDDVAQVRREALDWWTAGNRTHLKLKLFGNLPLDVQLIAAVREVFGPDAMIAGDANGGYGHAEHGTRDIEEIAADMRVLKAAGLSAIEDPMDYPDEVSWTALQRLLPELPLIADVVMRPARHAYDILRAGMAGAVNLHPDCMGSLVDAVVLGARVKQLGMKLMIGDNSLIGPGCSAWQQIGIGLGADWVEALEKPEECNVLQRCTISCATQYDAQHRIVRAADSIGFGLELDCDMLKAQANDVAIWSNSSIR